MTTHDERVARYEQVRALRAEGRTLSDIGAALEPPVSRERVRQMLIKGSPKALGRPRNDDTMRVKAILRLRAEGLTYEAIGAALVPPVTGARVRQVLTVAGQKPTGRARTGKVTRNANEKGKG